MPYLYFGTRVPLQPGDEIASGTLFTTLDAAAWEGELGPGDGPGRIYLVEPTGEIVEDLSEKKYPGPYQAFLSQAPLRVTHECTDDQGRPHRLYHGTKARLSPGDLIEPGHSANFGRTERRANHVYMAGTLDAAIWGAELARGEGPGRIYIVEPTGPISDDPNLTNKRFRGNPSRSYRSRHPVRVTAEVHDWQGHSPEAIRAMKEGLEKLADETIDD